MEGVGEQEPPPTAEKRKQKSPNTVLIGLSRDGWSEEWGRKGAYQEA